MDKIKQDARDADILIENLCGIKRIHFLAMFFMGSAKYAREVRLKFLRLSATDKSKVTRACRMSVKKQKNKASGEKIANKKGA